MAQQKINWNKIKKEFLRNRNASLKDIAGKYGVSYGYLRKIAMRQGWWVKKKEFWKEVIKMLDKEMQRIIKEKIKRSYKATNYK